MHSSALDAHFLLAHHGFAKLTSSGWIFHELPVRLQLLSVRHCHHESFACLAFCKGCWAPSRCPALAGLIPPAAPPKYCLPMPTADDSQCKMPSAALQW